MNKEFSHGPSFRRIEWDCVAPGLSISEHAPMLLMTFLKLYERVREYARKQNIILSQEAIHNLILLLVEESTDLIKALSLSTEPLFFDIAFDFADEVVGWTGISEDGSIMAITLNGKGLLEATQCLQALSFLKSDVEITAEMAEPVTSVIVGLAHELGHVRQIQQLVKIPERSQSWDAKTSPMTATEKERVTYIRNPLETNATGVAIRYLRQKAKIGDPKWGFFGNSEETLLLSIMAAGTQLDYLLLQEIQDEVRNEQSVTDLKYLEALLSKIKILLQRIETWDSRVAKLRQRLVQLSS